MATTRGGKEKWGAVSLSWEKKKVFPEASSISLLPSHCPVMDRSQGSAAVGLHPTFMQTGERHLFPKQEVALRGTQLLALDSTLLNTFSVEGADMDSRSRTTLSNMAAISHIGLFKFNLRPSKIK